MMGRWVGKQFKIFSLRKYVFINVYFLANLFCLSFPKLKYNYYFVISTKYDFAIKLLETQGCYGDKHSRWLDTFVKVKKQAQYGLKLLKCLLVRKPFNAFRFYVLKLIVEC